MLLLSVHYVHEPLFDETRVQSTLSIVDRNLEILAAEMNQSDGSDEERSASSECFDKSTFAMRGDNVTHSETFLHDIEGLRIMVSAA